MNRKIELSFDNRKEVMVLPINPTSFELSESNLNQTITLVNIGEVNLIGNRGLVSCSFSSFFPSPKSPFYKRASKSPMEYVNTLKKWKNSKKPIRVIISDSNINLAMAIEKLTYSKREGDEDVYYTIELTEYRFLNVPSISIAVKVKSNGLQARPDTKSSERYHTVVKGDCLWNIASKYYNGKGNQYPKIYNANKGVIDPRNQKYKMPKYTIYAGQKLVIPQ